MNPAPSRATKYHWMKPAVGSKPFRRGALRIKEVLTRNGHPYSYIDLDCDGGVQDILDHFYLPIL